MGSSVLGLYLLNEAILIGRHSLSESVIRKRQHLNREDGRVMRSIHSDGRHGNTGWHLDGGIERVHSMQGPILDGDANYRKGGLRRESPRKMGGSPGPSCCELKRYSEVRAG